MDQGLAAVASRRGKPRVVMVNKGTAAAAPAGKEICRSGDKGKGQGERMGKGKGALPPPPPPTGIHIRPLSTPAKSAPEPGPTVTSRSACATRRAASARRRGPPARPDAEEAAPSGLRLELPDDTVSAEESADSSGAVAETMEQAARRLRAVQARQRIIRVDGDRWRPHAGQWLTPSVFPAQCCQLAGWLAKQRRPNPVAAVSCRRRGARLLLATPRSPSRTAYATRQFGRAILSFRLTPLFFISWIPMNDSK
jgi:hypothetical protein